MKKHLIFGSLFLGVLMLAACAQAAAPPASTAEPPAVGSSPLETAPAQSDLPVPLPRLTLNGQLLALLDADNAAVKPVREASCYARITGRGTACVSYFEPFLEVQLVPPETDPAAAWREGYAEGICAENPFTDELPVLEIALLDEIDPSAPAVNEQDSLRQLFCTGAKITYPFLCKKLQQTPELTHTDEVYYLLPSLETLPHGNDPGQPIMGGDWRSAFLAGDVQIMVHFIQTGEELVAYYAVLSKQ